MSSKAQRDRAGSGVVPARGSHFRNTSARSGMVNLTVFSGRVASEAQIWVCFNLELVKHVI